MIAATRAAGYGYRLFAGIQDDPLLYRGPVLGHAVAAKGSAGSDKTSVVFSVPNRAGASMRSSPWRKTAYR
ncbi:MAG: hypothetical protein V8R49_00940 [Duodenibacillus massiliensis]